MATALCTLRLWKRLASGVLHYGRKKVWLDLNETNVIASANSHQQIQKLTKDGLIIWEPVTLHSWTPWQKSTLAPPEGQACGHGGMKDSCQHSDDQEGCLDEEDENSVMAA